MIIIIVLVLMAGLALAFLLPRREKLVEREVLSRAEHLASKQEMAKSYRCGQFARQGVRCCQRAPGRPCIKGCRGRLDLDIDWKG